METLDSFFDGIDQVLKSSKFIGCNLPVYRGHSKASYKLIPTLQREYAKTGKSINVLENNLYCDFRSLVGPKIKFENSWDLLFSMRHEGVPTRLLDWTENIGTALFFALDAPKPEDPHIWILNPYKLNKKHDDIEEYLVNPEEDFSKQYHETYVALCYDADISIAELPIAIYPRRSNDRIFAQRGLFTIHGKDENALEDMCPDCTHRIDIPKSLVEKLRLLISNFGINKYSVYPDFKGLSDHLKDIYKY